MVVALEKNRRMIPQLMLGGWSPLHSSIIEIYFLDPSDILTTSSALVNLVVKKTDEIEGRQLCSLRRRWVLDLPSHSRLCLHSVQQRSWNVDHLRRGYPNEGSPACTLLHEIRYVSVRHGWCSS